MKCNNLISDLQYCTAVKTGISYVRVRTYVQMYIVHSIYMVQHNIIYLWGTPGIEISWFATGVSQEIYHCCQLTPRSSGQQQTWSGFFSQNGHHTCSCLSLFLQSRGIWQLCHYANLKSTYIKTLSQKTAPSHILKRTLSNYAAEFSAGPTILKFTLGRLSLPAWLEGNPCDLHVIDRTTETKNEELMQENRKVKGTVL